MAFFSVTACTPKVLILGHSFVRRHKHFITIQARKKTDFALDSQPDVCTVCMLGIGGRTVDKMVRLDLPTIRDMAPDIVNILELGSNDLCDATSNAETTGLAIEAFAELLYHQSSFRYIMVCEVIPRSNQPFLHYNDKVKALSKAPFDGVWRHRELYHLTINICLFEGIHLNDVKC